MTIERKARALVERRLTQAPAVVLLGPRQVGKTTLAHSISAAHPQSLFLDLEREADRAAVQRPELFSPAHGERLVVLDEVQRVPQLFAALRPEIDADRSAGRFLLLGSASGDLLRQLDESLAGRVSYVELSPLCASEVAPDLATLQTLWLRGGYPLSYLAAEDEASFQWRLDFMLSFLQRDLPAMGVRTPADALRRFWTMLGHLQGQLFNASQLGLSLGGASHTTATRYLDTLVDTLMVRRLEPYLTNVGKRLVKSPKVIRARQRVAACAAGSCRHRRTAGPPGSRLVVGGFRRRANRRGLASGRARGLLSHRCGLGNRPGDRTALAQGRGRDQVFIGAQAGTRVLAGAAGPADRTGLRRRPGAQALCAGRGRRGAASGRRCSNRGVATSAQAA